MVDQEQMELIVHPVRSRIMSIVTDRTITATAIAESMGDVPRPTVFRHVHKLIDGGILRVVRETKVRGATEKWLEIREDRTEIGREELARMTDDQRWALVEYMLMMMGADYRNAMSHSDRPLPIPMMANMMLRLNEDDRKRFWTELVALVRKYKSDDSGGTEFSFASFLLPVGAQTEP